MAENVERMPMLECRQPPVISENLMDMGAFILAQKDMVLDMPRDREHIGTVKALRAQMRKEFDALENQRKAVKKAVLAPYEKAENLYKGFVSAPFSEFDNVCKAYVEEVETREKQECEERLKEYFAELCAMKGIFWLKWEQLGIRVDLATARQAEPKKAMERIRQALDGVEQTASAIHDMEDSADILAEYTLCLDLATAIQRVQARKRSLEIARENREKYEAVRARNQNIAQMAQNMADVGTVYLQEQEKKYRVKFTITATMPMLRGLKAFLDGHNFEYQEVTE